LEKATGESTQRDFLKRIFTSRRRPFTLRMAPMIDMIFLLLIFFLVAAKLRPEENFLPFQLSAVQTQGHKLAKPEPLIIHIFATDTGCQVQIGQLRTVEIENQTVEANLAALMEEIEKCLLAQKRVATDPVEIVCAPEVKWEHLAKIYNVFFGVGLTDITFRMTE
jgi:biopolymer transport protein ExbD